MTATYQANVPLVLFETLRADLARTANKGYAPKITLAIFRLGQYGGRNWRWLWLLGDRIYLRLLIGAELPPAITCGAGLALPHGGRGLVIHPDVSIGGNSMIFHRVTLAATAAGAPQLADNVTIGTGACVLGPVKVGSGAKIGANAVVVSDVPDGASVAAPAAIRVR